MNHYWNFFFKSIWLIILSSFPGNSQVNFSVTAASSWGHLTHSQQLSAVEMMLPLGDHGYPLSLFLSLLTLWMTLNHTLVSEVLSMSSDPSLMQKAKARSCSKHLSGIFVLFGVALNRSQILSFKLSKSKTITPLGSLQSLAVGQDYSECFTDDSQGSYLIIFSHKRRHTADISTE